MGERPWVPVTRTNPQMRWRPRERVCEVLMARAGAREGRGGERRAREPGPAVGLCVRGPLRGGCVWMCSSGTAAGSGESRMMPGGLCRVPLVPSALQNTSRGKPRVSERCCGQVTRPTSLPLQRAELCPPSVWSWTAGAPVPRLGPQSPTGPRAAGRDPERRLTRLPAALRHSVREAWLSQVPSIQRGSAQELGLAHFLKTHLLEQKPVMLYYSKFTR